MYKLLDIDYDKDQLLELFRLSKKDISKKNFVEATGDLINNPEVSRLLELFPFITPVSLAVGLAQLRIDVRPYINDGNNGLIIFPVYGNLDFKFYSYQAPIVNGRPSLSPARNAVPLELLLDIEENQVLESFIVDKPVAINGLVPHSYHVTNNRNPVFLVFKIPLDVTWDTVIATLG